jgi:hypothetical protein
MRTARAVPVTAESLIEKHGDQAYHKGLRMAVDALQEDDPEYSRSLARACIQLIKLGYQNKPRQVSDSEK